MEKGEEFLQDKVRVDVHPMSGITLSKTDQQRKRESNRKCRDRKEKKKWKKKKKKKIYAMATKRFGVGAACC